MSHTPSRTSIGGVGRDVVDDTASAVSLGTRGPTPGSPLLWDEVGVRPDGPPDAPSGSLERVGWCKACEPLTWRPHAHGRVPTMCWGATRQGPGALLLSGAAPAALLLKGDGCGGARTDTRGKRSGARRWSRWSAHRRRRRHPKKRKNGVHRKMLSLDKSRLKGDAV
jgi:hypothetical protein